MFCAKKVGYFDDIREELPPTKLRALNSKYENCLGKFSDSFEHALEGASEFLQSQKKDLIISHKQSLDPGVDRSKGYLLGGGSDQPLYEDPQVFRKTKVGPPRERPSAQN